MAASTALFVHGAKLYRGDGLLASSPTYTEVPNITEVGLPVGLDVEKLDATVHGSPNYTREFLPGLVTRNDVPYTVDFNHTNSVHQTLQTASSARTKVAWKVELPLSTSSASTNATYEWDGWATMGTPTAGAGQILQASGTLVVASDVTFTAET